MLDEAFSALDIASREHMRYLLRELVKDLNVTVLHVTHDMEDVWALADQVAVLHDGQVLQTGSPEHLFSCPRPGFVAEFLGARNVLEGTVRGCDAVGLTNIVIGRTSLYSIDPAAIGHRVLLSVRPEELAVSRRQLPITLRNQVSVKINHLERRGPLVWLTGEATGFCLEAAVTVSGAQQLGLEVGNEAIFAFSANSLRIIDRQQLDLPAKRDSSASELPECFAADAIAWDIGVTH